MELSNKEFNIFDELETCISLYNGTKHSTTGYSPKFLFNNKNEKIFENVYKNTIKSQKYRNKNINIIENRFGLLCERFRVFKNIIKVNNFGGKGRYRIPVKIIKYVSNNEYQIEMGVSYNGLNENNKYIADFTHLKLCDKKTWIDLIELFKNKK